MHNKFLTTYVDRSMNIVNSCLMSYLSTKKTREYDMTITALDDISLGKGIKKLTEDKLQADRAGLINAVKNVVNQWHTWIKIGAEGVCTLEELKDAVFNNLVPEFNKALDMIDINTKNQEDLSETKEMVNFLNSTECKKLYTDQVALEAIPKTPISANQKWMQDRPNKPSRTYKQYGNIQRNQPPVTSYFPGDPEFEKKNDLKPK